MFSHNFFKYLCCSRYSACYIRHTLSHIHITAAVLFCLFSLFLSWTSDLPKHFPLIYDVIVFALKIFFFILLHWSRMPWWFFSIFPTSTSSINEPIIVLTILQKISSLSSICSFQLLFYSCYSTSFPLYPQCLPSNFSPSSW